MKFTSLSEVARIVVMTLAFALLPLGAWAQDNSSSSNSSQTQRTTQTTTTSAPQTSTQVTRTTTRSVDPTWIALGAAALVAILAIVFLASRRRGPDRVETTTAVHERETVIKE
jgi:ABC-type Fe3+ transport system permease subunit